MPSASEFLTKFNRAKKLTTLEVMVEGEARRRRLYFDRSLSNYRVISQMYRELGNKIAAEMFAAAHKREEELSREAAVRSALVS